MFHYCLSALVKCGQNLKVELEYFTALPPLVWYAPFLRIIAIWVVKFQSEGYKIR